MKKHFWMPLFLLLLLSCSIHFFFFTWIEIGCWQTYLTIRQNSCDKLCFCFMVFWRWCTWLLQGTKFRNQVKLNVFLMFHYVMPTPKRNISKKCYTRYWHPKQVCLQHCNILHHLYQHVYQHVSFQRIHLEYNALIPLTAISLEHLTIITLCQNP